MEILHYLLVDQEPVDKKSEIKMVEQVNAVMAVQAIANIVKSSLGPVGLDKMIVDDIGV
jgi:T-complex protein 1 subunit alpha